MYRIIEDGNHNKKCFTLFYYHHSIFCLDDITEGTKDMKFFLVLSELFNIHAKYI